MARGGINRSFSWLKKVLEITEVTNAPDVLLPTVQPALDVFGWERFGEPETQVRSNPGVTSAVSLDTVPEGEMWFFLACAMLHNDTGSAKDVTLVLRNRLNVEIPVTNTGGISANFHRVLERPLLVPQGWQMRAISRNTINLTFDFSITGTFVRLDIGEYHPGAPYG